MTCYFSRFRNETHVKAASKQKTVIFVTIFYYNFTCFLGPIRHSVQEKCYRVQLYFGQWLPVREICGPWRPGCHVRVSRSVLSITRMRRGIYGGKTLFHCSLPQPGAVFVDAGQRQQIHVTAFLYR